MKSIILGFLLLISFSLQAKYPYNPHVSREVWKELEPHFLPKKHPAKEALDLIFSEKRVTHSAETFTEAGFTITRLNRPNNAVVSGHPKLKGYLIKAYLDTQLEIPEWEMWLRRIKGIKKIQKCIDRHQFTEFVLPQKWIYPLPIDPSPPLEENIHRKNFILVVEDMEILDKRENPKAYKEKMTSELLEDIFVVMTECQLTDCVWIGNMPFTKSGKITFIDTELFKNGIPEFERLKKYLSPPMQEHLDRLLIQ